MYFHIPLNGFARNVRFGRFRYKYLQAFIVCMFWWLPEVWSVVSHNAMISGTGKTWIPYLPFIYITSPIVSKWVLLEKKKTRKILIILWWYCLGCSPLYGQLFSQRVHPKPRLYTFSNCKHALGLRLQLQHVLISFMFHKPVFHDSPSIW